MKRSTKTESAGTIRVLMLVTAVFVVTAGVAGYAIYRERVAPFQTEVLIVDDTSIRMRYFLKRLHMSGREPLALLQDLTQEQVIGLVAPQPPYNIRVSEEDIDRLIRDAARGDAASITDGEVREWYRQQLNESQLSDDEFRDLIRRNLQTRRMSEYLAERTPTVAEQVHLYMITQPDAAGARALREQLLPGADFLALAREANSDENLRASSGEVGWLPRAALPVPLRESFDLPVGEPSQIIALADQVFAIVLVRERAAARQIEGAALEAVQADALSAWFNEEYRHHSVEFHGFTNGYDTETDLWVRWQLQRMRR